MQASSLPSKVLLPFANSGTKNTIPLASQIGVTAGAASLMDGFPPLTFTPLASGGVPPAGADFNGILNLITGVQQWQSAGGIFKYDSAFSTSVGGYPKGAVLMSTSNDTTWLNLADNNTTDPDGVSPSNWASLAAYGITAVSGLTNANVTLSSAQYGKNIITLAGALTGNVQIIFPTSKREWTVINNTTGLFTATCKTASGTGVAITQGGFSRIYGDGTNINVLSNSGRLINIQTITATGTYTPTAGMASALVEMVGGGAGGGGIPATTSGNQAGSGGGASGGYAKGWFTAAAIGASVACTIGAAGIAGAAGQNTGGNSGTTSFGALMSAPGSNGGQSTAQVTQGTIAYISGGNPGSIATGGNILNSKGNYGTPAYLSSAYLVAGRGGPSPLGGLSNYGAGGDGVAAGSSGAAATSGNAGVAGVIIVYEFA